MVAIGKAGEDAALHYLQQRDYQLIARNWRCLHGELDLIMQQRGQLVFVEVKARRSAISDEAAIGLTPVKRHRLTTTIYHYLDAHQLPADGWRLDLIVVIFTRGRAHIDHRENCLDW